MHTLHSIWDMSSGQATMKTDLEGAWNQIRGVTFSPDGRTIVTDPEESGNRLR